MRNIYTNLIRNENTFTEGFVNLLDNSKELRINFAALINEKFKDAGFTENDFLGTAQTQFYTKTNDSQKSDEIPDIVFKAKDKTVIIEVKINQGVALQNSQKELYYESFDKLGGENRYFIFLIPKGYKHENFIKIIGKGENKSAGNIKYSKIDWEEIVENCLCQALECSTVSDIEKFIIKPYYDILEKQLSIINIRFNGEDIDAMKDQNTIAVFVKLTKLIERINQEYATCHISYKESSIELYIKSNKHQQGYDLGFLINHESESASNLNIVVWDNELANKHNFLGQKKDGGKGKKGNPRHIYPVNIELLNDNEDAGNQIIDLFNDIIADRAKL